VTVTTIANASETGTIGIFRFARTDTTQALTFNFATGGTATSGVDYQALPPGVTFAPGQATIDVEVLAFDDSVKDPNETVSVSVTPGAGYDVGNPASATLTIADNPFLVDTTGDLADANLADLIPLDANGNVSLRAAIQQANFNAAFGQGTNFSIRFASALFPVPGTTTTITLVNGPLNPIDANVSITGPGADVLHIAGTGAGGMFKFNAGYTSSIGYLTLTEGRNEPGVGSGRGGAIENLGTLNLHAVRITNCGANDGGAIYNANRLDLLGCTVTGNYAFMAGGANAWGGGLSVAGLDNLTTIRSSIIMGNSGGGRGGGIAVRLNARVELTDTEVLWNYANEWGGGVYNSGGIFFMTRGKLEENSAGASAGGLHSNGNSTLTDVPVRGNTAVANGGGIYLATGMFTMTGGVIEDNSVLNLIRPLNGGGGIYQAGATATFQDVTVSNNWAPNGGGIFQNGGTNTFQNGTVSNNAATEWGGGVYINGGTLDFTGTTFAGNTAQLGGPKIAKKGNPTITLTNCVGIVPADIQVDTRP
jgi:hypothetical protein